MSNPAHFRKLEHLFTSSPCNDHIDTTIKINEGYAEVTIQVRPDLLHSGGVLHGSVYFKAMDDAATFAANSLVEDAMLVTASFTVYFVRPVSDGMITAKGRVVHQSRRLLIAEAEVVNSQGRQVARGSGTFMRSRVRHADSHT